jgi:hypothetical protein
MPRGVPVPTEGAYSCWVNRRVIVGACGPCATDGFPDRQADVVVLRYLDVCLVLATAPFVLVAGLPMLGYLVGACAWLLTRMGVEALYARARSSTDPRVQAALQVGAMMGRVWIVALAVIVARYAGSKDDGIMAAALVLAAFTVYFMLTLVQRGGRGLDRKPSPS